MEIGPDLNSASRETLLAIIAEQQTVIDDSGVRVKVETVITVITDARQ